MSFEEEKRYFHK